MASPQQREACWTVLVVVTLGMQGGSGVVYVGASAFWAWVDSNLAIENGTAQLASQVVDERIWMQTIAVWRNMGRQASGWVGLGTTRQTRIRATSLLRASAWDWTLAVPDVTRAWLLQLQQHAS